MVTIPIPCPNCHRVDVIKAGTQPNGTQRYRCQNSHCKRTIFLLTYNDKGRQPEVKKQMVEMALNGSGIRDTARVLGVSPGTVINELKKNKRRSTASIRRR
jgi:insertion element IS1 protein InsB